MNIKKTFPYILIIGSIVGLLASFFLMIDTISLIKDPQTDLPCNLNPFISCGNAILSEQGEVFGFPNPLLGIISFSMLLSAGILLLLQKPHYETVTKTKGEKIFWLFVNLGLLASFIFVIWFLYQSLYSLGTLCIYCMVVWVITWPLFLYNTIWNLKENNFSLVLNAHFQKSIEDFLQNYHLQILILWYLAVILAVLTRFKDFFLY